jgi:DNA-binding transcriptional MocR family regulator
VTGGAHDGIERVLQAQLHVGDRVGVEDPSDFVTIDLVRALGLRLTPIKIDSFGILPKELAQALEAGIDALIITPRAQNPTGAALDPKRARELRALLGRHPDVLLMENDFAGLISGVPAMTLAEPNRVRWAVIRSVSKFLGPDLRLALIAGDALTMSRLEARQDLGPCWVSHILQRIVASALKNPAILSTIRHASQTYAQRRAAFVAALRKRRIETVSRCGIHVWVPVMEEGAVIQGLLNAGWAVRAGERFRIKSPPAIRIMTSRLPVEDSDRLASEIARYIGGGRSPVSAR